MWKDGFNIVLYKGLNVYSQNVFWLFWYTLLVRCSFFLQYCLNYSSHRFSKLLETEYIFIIHCSAKNCPELYCPQVFFFNLIYVCYLFLIYCCSLKIGFHPFKRKFICVFICYFQVFLHFCLYLLLLPVICGNKNYRWFLWGKITLLSLTILKIFPPSMVVQDQCSL